MTPDTDPVLDPEVIEGLEQLGTESGNDTFIAQLVDLFRANAPARLARIGEAITVRDGKELERVAHTLKSNCSMLGATLMAGYCKDLEAMGERQAFEEAAALLPRATVEFARVAKAIDALTARESPKSPE